jgi:hypothetical protein
MFESFNWESAINAARDVAVAKRNQPSVVQGVAAQSVPMSRNNGAVVGGGGGGLSAVGGANPAVLAGLALLLVGGLFVMRKMKR